MLSLSSFSFYFEKIQLQRFYLYRTLSCLTYFVVLKKKPTQRFAVCRQIRNCIFSYEWTNSCHVRNRQRLKLWERDYVVIFRSQKTWRGVLKSSDDRNPSTQGTRYIFQTLDNNIMIIKIISLNIQLISWPYIFHPSLFLTPHF